LAISIFGEVNISQLSAYRPTHFWCLAALVHTYQIDH